MFITYNVVAGSDYRQSNVNTILIHRKKQTNTLYTINALNEIVKMETGGKDYNYEVPWEQHQNSILLSDAHGLKKINTRVFEIVNV